MSDLNVGTLSATAELKDNISPALLAIANANSKGVTSLGSWTAAQQRAAMAMAGTHAEALKLNAAMDDSAGGFSKMTSALSSLGGVAAGAAGALAAVGGAVVAGLGLAVHSVLDMADKMSNLSASTGIGVEALQKFQFAGAAVGVSAEQIGSAMQKFQKNLVEGSKESLAAITQLGLSRTSLANMLPEEQLSTVLEALNDKIPNAANRTQIAMALLGKSGADLVPLGAGIRDAMASAEDLGVVLSAKDVGAADALGDSIGVLGMTFGGLVNNIGAAITSNESLHVAVESVTKIVGDLSKGVHDNRDAMESFVSGGVELVVSGMQVMVSGIELAINAVDGLRLAWLSAKNIGGDLARAQLEIRLAAAKSNQYGDDPTSPKADPKAIADLEQQIDMVKKWQAELSDKANGVVAGNSKWADSTQKVSAALAALQTKLAAVHGEQAKGGSGSAGSGGPAILKANEEQAKAAEEAAKKADAVQKQMMDGMDAAAEKLRNWYDQLAGPGQGEVLHQLEDIGNFFAKDMAAGVQVSTEQVEKLRQKLMQLQNQSPAAFNTALSTTAGVGSILTSSSMGGDLAGKAGNYLSGTAQNIFGGFLRPSDPQTEKSDAEKAEAAAHFRRNLDEASDALLRMGDSLGGFAGGLARLAGGIGGAFASGNKATALFGRKDANGNALPGSTTGDKISGGAQAAEGLFEIYQANKHNLSAAGGAASGAASGAAIGTKIMPGYGTAIGAIVGGAIGLFSGSKFRDEAKKAGKVLGQTLSKEAVEQIEGLSKKLHISIESASLLNISGAMADSGKDPRTYSDSIIKLLGGIKDGTIPAKEGLEELAKDFGAVADAALKAGSVGDKSLVSILKAGRAAGGNLYTPEMKEFTAAQLGAAGAGVGGMVGGLKINTQADAQAQGTIFSTTFWATVKELGITGAADAFKDTFAKLGESLKGSGFDISGILDPIQQIMNLSGNDLFRGAADGAQGLRQALEGIANAGYLTTDSFNAFEQQAKSAFDQAIAGGATSAQAYQLIAPLLNSLVDAAGNYDQNLDDATKALIEQAKAAGVAFKTDPTERLTASIDALTVALGGVPPKVDEIGRSLRNLPPIPTGDTTGGGGPTPPPYDGARADGGWTMPSSGGRGRIIRVAENEPEFTGTAAQWMRQAGGGISGGGNMSWGDIHIYGAPTDAPEEFAAKILRVVRDDIGGVGQLIQQGG